MSESQPGRRRRIAVAVPARDEAVRIVDCLESLARAADRADGVAVTVTVFANNCRDRTADLSREFAATAALPVHVVEAELAPARANAGWARREAFDAAAATLDDGRDVLCCTDADTRVTSDWLSCTLAHLDAGYDAVAGLARLDPRELRRLAPGHRAKLAALRRYEDAVDRVRAARSAGGEAWPRHFYEGGASIALTLAAYRAIGGAPTPPVSEDKALFAAVRAQGFRIRHARDVRVLTSCRFDGRAPGGAADTLAAWCAQGPDHTLWGVARLAGALDPSQGAEPLTFNGLAAETRDARRLRRSILRSEPVNA